MTHASDINRRKGYETMPEVTIESRVVKRKKKDGFEYLIHYSPRVKWKLKK